MNYQPVLHNANLVENLCFVCWDNLQVGLQGLDFGGEIFSDLLDGLVMREEVECLIDVSPENIYTPEFFYQFDLEGGPVNFVVERSSFGKGDGILSESHLNIVFSLGQVEPVQDGRQPGVEICVYQA